MLPCSRDSAMLKPGPRQAMQARAWITGRAGLMAISVTRLGGKKACSPSQMLV